MTLFDLYFNNLQRKDYVADDLPCKGEACEETVDSRLAIQLCNICLDKHLPSPIESKYLNEEWEIYALATLHKTNEEWYKYANMGCYYKLIDGTLYFADMDTDGSMVDNAGEVEFDIVSGEEVLLDQYREIITQLEERK